MLYSPARARRVATAQRRDPAKDKARAADNQPGQALAAPKKVPEMAPLEMDRNQVQAADKALAIMQAQDRDRPAGKDKDPEGAITGRSPALSCPRTVRSALLLSGHRSTSSIPKPLKSGRGALRIRYTCTSDST